MRRCISLAAAALLVAVAAYGAQRRTDTNYTADSSKPQPAAKMALPAGFVATQSDQTAEIYGQLAAVTHDGLTPNRFDSLIGNLVDQDRVRVGDYKDRDFTTLNAKISDFRSEWQSKYGADFEITDPSAVFGPRVAVMTGEVSNVELAVANWPINPLSGKPFTPDELARMAAARESQKAFGGEVNLDKGRNVALAELPGEYRLPDITLSLIHELPDQWRFDIPNDISGPQIHDSLLAHINYLLDHKDRWPAGAQDGYRMVTHHVMMALYNISPSGHGQGGSYSY